ncbi:hypothetical protein DQ04_00541030 [Trypanosoma grayi]|uniref:hypothetical protein n=1 Tax=Trypanosoma grayi TaxID=71804 RepID=UPI0004F45CBD|nr:hypothetical protein DQ04_00541030 [Trypanosoma grayi]KEG14271.1 hypothetical protein DQ04_00541030 [Trypanosoma grayi]
MQQGGRYVTTAALSQVQKEAARVLGFTGGFSSGVMKTVEFLPEKVATREDGTLSFPWTARYGALNGFKSTHGGALATLADAFTRVHLGAAAPGSSLSSVSFEISYLAAIGENVECACVTRLVSRDAGSLAFMDYSFEDEKSGQVFARGTHVLSCSK